MIALVATAQLPMYARATPTMPTPMATQASLATFPFARRPARTVAFALHMEALHSASVMCSTGLAQLARNAIVERLVHFMELVTKECRFELNVFLLKAADVLVILAGLGSTVKIVGRFLLS